MDSEQLKLCKAIKCDEIKKGLHKDYLQYLKNRLIEYQKTDFTVAHIDEMRQKSVLFTGDADLYYNINRITDGNGNTFAHCAVKKGDINILRRLCDFRWSNKNCQELMDLCINKLMPSAPEQGKLEARDMLGIILEQ